MRVLPLFCFVLSGLLLAGLAADVQAQRKPPHGRPKPPPPQPIYAAGEAPLAPPLPAAYIELRTEPAIIDRVGVFTQTASCSEGQQLLGGGYFSGASAPYPYAVSIQANYPSSDMTWTAVFHNARAPETVPLSPLLAPFKDVVVAAYAYCLNAPGYPLQLTTQVADNSTQPTQASTNATGYQGVPQSWNVTCPQGSVLTGGGFAVDGPFADTDVNSNADLTASLPTLGSDRIANGWRISLVAFRPDTVRRVRAYARCARQGLSARAAAVLARDLTQAPFAAQEHELQARCPGDAISTGGGHEYKGDWLIPHPLFYSRASGDFRDWGPKAFGAYQTTRYTFRPCDPQSAQCLEGAVVASCFAPPDIPYINVRIVSPPDRHHFDLDSYGSASTEKIVFTAKVYDRSGALLPAAEVDWSYSSPAGSIALASGQQVVARLPAGQTVNSLALHAVARQKYQAGKARGALTAKDAIQLTTGTVP